MLSSKIKDNESGDIPDGDNKITHTTVGTISTQPRTKESIENDVRTLFERFATAENGSMDEATENKNVLVRDLPAMLADFEEGRGEPLIEPSLFPQLEEFCAVNTEFTMNLEALTNMVASLQDALPRDNDQPDEFHGNTEDASSTSREESGSSGVSDEESASSIEQSALAYQESVPSPIGPQLPVSSPLVFNNVPNVISNVQNAPENQTKSSISTRHRKTASESTVSQENFSPIEATDTNKFNGQDSDDDVDNAVIDQRISCKETRKSGKAILAGKGRVSAPPAAWIRPKPQVILNRGRHASESGVPSQLDVDDFDASTGGEGVFSSNRSVSASTVKETDYDRQKVLKFHQRRHSRNRSQSLEPNLQEGDPTAGGSRDADLSTSLSGTEQQYSTFDDPDNSIDLDETVDTSTSNLDESSSSRTAAALKEEYAATHAHLEATIADQESTIERLMTEVEVHSKVDVDRMSEVRKQLEEISKLRNEVSYTKNELSNAVSSLEQARTKSDDLENVTKLQLQRIQALQETARMAEQDEKEHDQLRAEWEACEARYKIQIEQLDSQKAQLEGENLNFQNMRQINASLQQRVEQLATQVAEVDRASNVHSQHAAPSLPPSLSKRLGKELASRAEENNEFHPETETEQDAESLGTFTEDNITKTTGISLQDVLKFDTIPFRTIETPIQSTKTETTDVGQSVNSESNPPTYEEAEQEKSTILFTNIIEALQSAERTNVLVLSCSVFVFGCLVGILFMPRSLRYHDFVMEETNSWKYSNDLALALFEHLETRHLQQSWLQQLLGLGSASSTTRIPT